MLKKLRDEMVLENNKRITEHGNLLLETNILNSKVHRQRVDHSKMVERLEGSMENISKLQKDVMVLDSSKAGTNESKVHAEFINDKIKTINDKLDAHRSNSDKIEMFIDKYIPIRIQS